MPVVLEPGEESGEFLSPDAGLTHAIGKYRELQTLCEEAVKVVAKNAHTVHATYHIGIVAATQWEECSIRTCREAVELKRKVELACGAKVPVPV